MWLSDRIRELAGLNGMYVIIAMHLQAQVQASKKKVGVGVTFEPGRSEGCVANLRRKDAVIRERKDG